MLYIIFLIGWPVLWFKPDWRWFAIVSLVAIAPTVLFYGYFAFEAGVGIRGTIINMINQLPFPLVVFCVPGAAIVALRQWMLSRKNDPAPPR